MSAATIDDYLARLARQLTLDPRARGDSGRSARPPGRSGAFSVAELERVAAST
jgi:hypothetical protein